MSPYGCAGYFQDRSKLYMTANELADRFTHLVSKPRELQQAARVG
jgi:hypothetical protein